MYGNSYNNQMYVNDLQQIRDRIDRQLQMISPPQPQTPQINQNFQLAPSQNSQSIKYAESLDEIKKELVFSDTLFVNKAFNLLWFKNASGEVKTYEIKEMVVKDEKDLKIEELEAKLNMLLKEREENESEYDSKYAIGTTTSKKSTNGKSN